MTWLPTYFAMGRGIDLKQSAIYSMLPYLVAILAYPLGGLVTDAACRRFGQNIGRKLSPVAGLLLAGVFLILGTRANSLWSAATLISASNFSSVSPWLRISPFRLFSPRKTPACWWG
jgi:hypothetical protein